MTVEEVKSKLHSVRPLKIRLMGLRMHINELTKEICGVNAVDYSGVRVKSSAGNTVEKRYLKYAERLKTLQDRHDALFTELCALEDELSERMKRLTAAEYNVINARFMDGIDNVSLLSVAHKFVYSLDGIKVIQKRAIKKMADD